MFHVPNLLTTLAHCNNRGHVANPNPRRKCANIHSFDSWSKLVAFVATILPEAAFQNKRRNVVGLLPGGSAGWLSRRKCLRTLL